MGRLKQTLGPAVPIAGALALWVAVVAGGAAKTTPTPAAGTAVTAVPGQAGGYVGEDTCLTCHPDQQYTRTKHANAAYQDTPAATHGCESCHGPGQAHVDGGGDKTQIKSPQSMSPREINTVCLTCHEKDNQANYIGSMHDRRNVACTSCHSIHSPKSDQAQLKTRTATESCYTCHPAMRAKMMRTSHHPVREGKMECTSCHNPHDGSRPKMIKADSVNELCYTCHTEKRGPFAFEHAPVREDCASCHEPHGTNHPRLLTQKLPNLCWNCHFSGSGHFGSGDNASTEKGVTVAPPGSPSGYPTVNSRFVERACRTCHVKLHGSNHPSGAYFVR